MAQCQPGDALIAPETSGPFMVTCELVGTHVTLLLPGACAGGAHSGSIAAGVAVAAACAGAAAAFTTTAAAEPIAAAASAA
eukprot:1615764-Prymnesium_polylepis.1